MTGLCTSSRCLGAVKHAIVLDREAALHMPIEGLHVIHRDDVEHPRVASFSEECLLLQVPLVLLRIRSFEVASVVRLALLRSGLCFSDVGQPPVRLRGDLIALHGLELLLYLPLVHFAKLAGELLLGPAVFAWLRSHLRGADEVCLLQGCCFWLSLHLSAVSG